MDVSLLKDELILEDSQCKCGVCQYVDCMNFMALVSEHDIL